MFTGNTSRLSRITVGTEMVPFSKKGVELAENKQYDCEVKALTDDSRDFTKSTISMDTTNYAVL